MQQEEEQRENIAEQRQAAPISPPPPPKRSGPIALGIALLVVVLLGGSLLGLGLAGVGPFASLGTESAGVITEFSVPTSKSELEDIIKGPDGNLWFTERDGNKIGRITSGK